MAHQALLTIAPSITMRLKNSYVPFSGSAITRRTQFLGQSQKGLTLRAKAKKDGDDKKDDKENWSDKLGKIADDLKGFEKFNKLINSLGYLKLLVEALRFLYKKKLITAPTFLLPLFEDDEKKEGGEKGDEGSGKSRNEAQNITCENLYWNWTTTIHCVNLHKAEEKEPVDDENAHGTTDNESK